MYTKMSANYLRECYRGGQHLFEQIDVSGEDFTGFNIPNITFKYCLIEETIFEGANLEGAVFLKNRMSRIKFKGANLHKMDFSGIPVVYFDFRNCNLQHTKWDEVNIAYCDFGGSDVSHADFRKVTRLKYAKTDRIARQEGTKWPKNLEDDDLK